MSAHLLLEKAAKLGVELFVAADRIKGRGPKPNPAFVAELRTHEAEIIAFLRAPRKTSILFRDYETRSTLNLRDVGAARYASHAETEIWCCAYAKDNEPVKLWCPGDPIPEEFIAAARNPDWVVSAFNDHFERLIEQHIMAPRYGWPMVPIERHRCSQAAALALALPAALENVAIALSLEHQKDKVGHDNMLKMSKPRKSRKGEDPDGLCWFDDPERRERLYAYCKQDVETERSLHNRIWFLPSKEQEVWVLDAVINDRGIYIDTKLAKSALRVAATAHDRINEELSNITGGMVTSINQTSKLLELLSNNECDIPNIRKGTLERALTKKDIGAKAKQVIELRLDGAHAAANKFSTMLDWQNADGRIRGAFKYHGASTGRWSSLGVQLQNMKRPLVEDLGAAVEAVATGDYDHLCKLYPRPMSVVGDTSRAVICSRPGYRLIAADFSGIESRVTAWLSGQQSKIAQWAKFDRTKDPEDEPYLIIGKACGLPPDQARSKGKICDLAFGYQGGEGAYRALAPDDPSSSEEIKQYRQAWRNENPETVSFWRNINRAAIGAVHTRRGIVDCNARVSFTCDDTFLRMRLPSNRELAYPFPRLITTDRGNYAVVYMDNQQGKWVECHFGQGAYGGIWTENAVSATARDVFAAAMPRLEAAGYPIVLHVHDEIVAEVPVGSGSTEEFLQIITESPKWATGLPIAAKVREGERFCKIKSNIDMVTNPKEFIA